VGGVISSADTLRGRAGDEDAAISAKRSTIRARASIRLDFLDPGAFALEHDYSGFNKVRGNAWTGSG
jgi:hypothetical protein